MPQPAARRRTLPPKPTLEASKGTEDLQISTPTSHEGEINADKSPQAEQEMVQTEEQLQSPRSQQMPDPTRSSDPTPNGAADHATMSSEETTIQTAQKTGCAVQSDNSTMDSRGSDASAEKEVGGVMRKTQCKRKEIRRLDQLAKEALEKDF